MARIALKLAYVGTGYRGWQTQLDGQGLQDDLELALATIALEPVRVVCAGRTDADVHALSQVVHFDTEAVRPLRAWVKGVNRCLAEHYEQVRRGGFGRMMVREAEETKASFHARFSAIARTYYYVIYNDRDWHPHWIDRSGFYYRPLSLEAMKEAASHLIGRHDFSSFRAAQCQATSPVRSVHAITINAYRPLILVKVKADGFLHHMIRNMVGALLAIGCGDEPPIRMRHWLKAAERSLLPPTFAPGGLYFAGADYAPDALSFPTVSGMNEIFPAGCLVSATLDD